MNEVDIVLRGDPHIICNKCKKEYQPYPMSHAPIIDEVVCPNCGEKRLLYFGEDTTVVKMILSNIGVNKELTEKLTELERQIGLIETRLETLLVDARNVMTTAVVSALKEQIAEHEKQWHDFGGKRGK